jgi:ABC-2 type transport system permease protein
LSLTGRSLREESEVTFMSTLVADTRNVFQREMSLVLRDPFSVIFSLVQPLVFLALFGPLLAGSVDPAAINGASPLQWFLPGVIVMICLFGTSTTGANLLFEITMGSYERVLAAPLHRSSILIGKALKELAPLVVQAALVTLVSIPFGFKLYPYTCWQDCCCWASSGWGWVRSRMRSPSHRASGSGCSGQCSSRCCSRC